MKVKKIPFVFKCRAKFYKIKLKKFLGEKKVFNLNASSFFDFLNHHSFHFGSGKRLCAFVAALFLNSFAAWTQDSEKTPWYSNVYLQADYCHYFVPAELDGLVECRGGVRGSAGYAIPIKGNLSVPVGIEGGYSHLVGTNPVIKEMKVFPVTLYAGIAWSPLSFLSLNASVDGGIMISDVKHYRTVLDNKRELISESVGYDVLLGARAGLSLELLNRCISFYADGGIDVLMEIDGPIPLFAVNAGLRIYPGRVYGASKILTRTVTVEKVVEVSEYFADRVVLFAPESIALSDESVATLSKVGAHMQKFAGVKLELTGYAAPYGTKSEQLEIAEKRSQVVRDYICTQYGISGDRIIVRRAKVATEDARESENELIQLRSVVCHIYE